jgi:hypothetical protein
MPKALRGGVGPRGGPPPDQYIARARVGPSPARLGEQLLYQGGVLVTPGARVRFQPPQSGGNFTWGTPRAQSFAGGKATYHPAFGYFGADSYSVEIPLQVFATGVVSIPGPGIGVAPRGRIARLGRFAVVRLVVLPTVTAGDSSATLRPVHGPLGAPWWERVPWRWVIAGLLVLIAVIALVRARRRRKRVPAVVAPVARARPAPDPSSEALAALARLRALKLPAQRRFGEHSFELTRILRRYLEATLGTPRPGDTSPELIGRLRAGRIDATDLRRLEGLLALWDRVKFARAPLDVAEAERCESAVEELVRRRELPREVA